MQSIDIIKKSKIHNTAKILQLKGLYDYPDDENITFSINIDIDLPDNYNIGLIVGPSGSGKTTILRDYFGADKLNDYEFDNKSVFDNFNLPAKKVIEIFGMVGFNTIPSWMLPFKFLSNGEQFRVQIAKKIEQAILKNEKCIYIDEFTSVVDRQIGKIVSVNLAKIIRKLDMRVICASCHYDIIDWLDPDWIIDTATHKFRRRLRRGRPKINCEIGKLRASDAWGMFKRFHYMNQREFGAVKAYGAYINKQLVGYISYFKFPHKHVKNMYYISRVVVSPDYQGLGIAKLMLKFVCDKLKNAGFRVRSRVAHPGMIHIYKNNGWRLVETGTTSIGYGRVHKKSNFRKRMASRVTRAFEYVG